MRLCGFGAKVQSMPSELPRLSLITESHVELFFLWANELLNKVVYKKEEFNGGQWAVFAQEHRSVCNDPDEFRSLQLC